MEQDWRVKVVAVSPRQYRCPSTVQILTPQLGRHSYSWYSAGIQLVLVHSWSPVGAVGGQLGDVGGHLPAPDVHTLLVHLTADQAFIMSF